MERTAIQMNCYDPAMDISTVARGAKEIEKRGFEAAFYCETIELMWDWVSAMTGMGMVTESVNLGCTQVVRLRTPATLAVTLMSLDKLTDGRMILGLGACTKTQANRHGIEPIDPAVTLLEWIESTRLLLSGEKVSYGGQVITFKDVQLGMKPLRTRIPFWIAATSRKGLKLAGQLADGVVLNAICSPEYTVNALKIVRTAAEEAGKNWDDFEVAQIVNCSLEDDHEKALDAVRWEVANKFGPNQLPFVARPKMRVGEPFIKEDDIPRFEEAFKRGGKEALLKAVPDSYVEGMTASGTEDEVLAGIQRFREAGVRLPILRPAATHQTQPLLDLCAPGQRSA